MDLGCLQLETPFHLEQASYRLALVKGFVLHH